MAQDSELNTVLAELSRVNIKPAVDEDGKHIKIAWSIPKHPERLVVVAKTGSDYRGRLNARAVVRRMLRSDGVEIRPMAKNFIEVTPVDPIPDQLEAMRLEMDDMSSLMLELHDLLTSIKASLTPSHRLMNPRVEIKIASHNVEVTHTSDSEEETLTSITTLETPIIVPELPQPSEKRKRTMNKTKIEPFLSFSFQSLQEIAKASGISPRVVTQKLYYLKRMGSIECKGGQYRKIAR